MSFQTRKLFHELSESGKRKRLAVLANKDQPQKSIPDPMPFIPAPSGLNLSTDTDMYDADLDDSDLVNDELNFAAEEELSEECSSNVDNFHSVRESGFDSDFFCDSDDSEFEFAPEELFGETIELSDDPSKNAFKNFENIRSCNIVQLLIHWALMYKVKMNALSALLKLLKQFPCFSDISKDARTLLKTPLTENARAVDDGEYYHFGLWKSMSPFLKLLPQSISELKLIINVDGLPLFKSSDSQLWPILVSIVGLPKKVFCVGLYHGHSKPEIAEIFLQEFIEELNDLIGAGFRLNDGKILPVSVFCIVCDAPAKAFLLGCKGHSGYNSCTRCTQKGEWIGHKIVFPDMNSAPRTHEDFLNKTDEEFHHKPSVFEQVPGVNMISTFCLDYMHLVCLGVVRRMIKLWICGKVPFKISSSSVFRCSEQLFNFRAYIPAEFCRKPRDFDLIKRWKATELRQFLLYTGPVILKSALDDAKYDNFLVLFVAMRVLLSPSLVLRNGYIQYARELLLNFVVTFKALYSVSFLTHNFHNLIHLADDAEKFGSLDLVSAFKFENYLQTLKSLVRKPSAVLSQIIRRTGEINCSESQANNYNQSTLEEPQFLRKLSTHPIPYDDICEPHYSSIKVLGFKISTNRADSCVGTADGKIVVVQGISFSPKRNCLVIVGKSFNRKSEFFTRPCESSLIGVYKVSKQSSVSCWPVATITTKYILLPFRAEFVALPLLHSDKD